MTEDRWPSMKLAESCMSRLIATGATVATAESLTAGLISATLATVPGASAALRGGVASYATEAKASVLHVPESVLAEHGAVSAECASAMAEAARTLFDATLGISATGVAGPDQQEGKEVGTVFLAVADAGGVRVVELALTGDRNDIRTDSAEGAISLLLAVLPTEAGNAVGTSQRPHRGVTGSLGATSGRLPTTTERAE